MVVQCWRVRIVTYGACLAVCGCGAGLAPVGTVYGCSGRRDEFASLWPLWAVAVAVWGLAVEHVPLAAAEFAGAARESAGEG